MSILKDLGRTVNTVNNNERLTELHRNQQALAEGMSIARSSGNRARMDNLQVQEENLELMTENQQLKGALTEARNLLEEMSMRNETFARTILHLRRNWEPNRSDDDKREAVRTIIASKEKEVIADPAYQTHLSGLKERINPRRKVR